MLTYRTTITEYAEAAIYKVVIIGYTGIGTIE